MGVLKKKDNSNEMLLIETIADLIKEEYRFIKSYISITNKLFLEERPKYIATVDFHINKVIELATSVNLAIQDFEGRDFDDGLPIVALNIDDFEKEDTLIIKQTIEPSIIHKVSGKAIRFGSVILAKKDNTQN